MWELLDSSFNAVLLSVAVLFGSKHTQPLLKDEKQGNGRPMTYTGEI